MIRQLSRQALGRSQWKLVLNLRQLSTQSSDVELEEQVVELLEDEYSHASLTLLGRVGNTPEKVTTKTGNTFVSFALGTTSGMYSKTMWHTLHSFFPNNQDYILRNVQSGDRVLVEARLKLREPTEGGNRYYISVEEIKMLQKAFKNQERRDENWR